MKKQKKEHKTTFRFRQETVEKLRKMSEMSGISQANIVENLINDNIIFEKDELNEMRLCIRSFMLDSREAAERFPTLSEQLKQQASLLETIVGKIEILQKYYKW